MIFSKAKIFTILIAILVASPFALEVKTGKVRYVVGDVQILKKGKDPWKALHMEQPVKEKDHIRTGDESTASIGFPDGSVVTVQEHSEVEFSELLFKNGDQVSMTEVKKGMARFDVQKQKPKGSFAFKTGTATCSIRGTDGVVGISEGGQVLGALNSGAMDMEQDGQQVSVKPQQFAVFRKGSAPIVGDAKNAGDPEFLKKMGELADDTTKSVDDILKAAKEIDAQIEEKKQDLMKKYNIKAPEVPKETNSPSAEIRGTWPAGMDVTVGDQTKHSEGEELVFTPEWAGGPSGDRKFVVLCSIDSVTFECGRVNTHYNAVRTATFGDYDESKGVAKFSTKGFDGNPGTVKVMRGNHVVKGFAVDADTTFEFPIELGEYAYTLEFEGGNGKEEKKLRYFPETGVSVEFIGGNQSTKKGRKISQGGMERRELKFILRNVLNNDPAQIKSVEVRVAGKNFSVDYAPSKEGIGYKSDILLPRGKAVDVLVVVVMKNGKEVVAKKTFEDR